MKTIKELKQGNYFTTKPIEDARSKDIWVRDEYDRAEKKYLCHNYANNNRWKYFDGGKTIFDVF